MSLGFAVKLKDLMGRIGIIKTRSGNLETPHMFPVLDPRLQGIPPKFIKERMKCNGVMTNAYLLMKHLSHKENRIEPFNVHEYLGFDGIVATDSGAYQILLYGKVKVSPQEIVRFQNVISTDIGVILDIPTGLTSDRLEAEYTVKETLKRAGEALKVADPRILWIGPIQGGLHKDLLTLSAHEMAQKPFQIYGLGSPTPIMERYLFDKLVDMIVHVKRIIPGDKPLHLFGAGHPMIFPLIVACGVDTFDSAAYALYARDERYMTPEGSLKLSMLEYFPCSCRQCIKYTPNELRSLKPNDRIRILSEHNLWICIQEVKRIREAISEGRLWELVHLRSLSHPSLHRAFKKIKRYSREIERLSPVTKRRGLSIFTHIDYYRPEVVRHIRRLFSRCTLGRGSSTLVMLPSPLHFKGEGLEKLIKIRNKLRNLSKVKVVYYGHPYGIIPVELDDVYPLGQTEISAPVDREAKEIVSRIIRRYLHKIQVSRVVLILEPNLVAGNLIKNVKEDASKKGYEIKIEDLSTRSLDEVNEKLKYLTN